MRSSIVSISVLVCTFLTLDVCVGKPPKYHEYTYEVPLDHFDFSNSATFNIRYLIADTKALTKTSASGELPVMLFYTGNEGPIELFYKNAGFMTRTLASKFNAVVVFAEHRFFGKSFPGQQKKKMPWQYCTVEQTLRDYASLIEYLQGPQQYHQKFQVIAGGGSYGGMLSAWFRQHYPNTVFASIAASAPLYQYTNETKPEAFFGRVTKNFYVAGCGKQMRQALGSITPWTDKQKKTAATLTDIKEGFQLCPSHMKEDALRHIMTGWWQGLITDLGMVNYPFPSDFIQHITKGYPIKSLCEVISKSTTEEMTLKSLRGQQDEDELEATPLEIFKSMRKGLESIGILTKGKCFDIGQSMKERLTTYSGAMLVKTASMMQSAEYLKEMMLEEQQDDAEELEGPLGDLEGWSYLVCTTQTMPMSTTGKTDFFPPSPWSVKKFEDGCKKQFPFMKRKPDYKWPEVYEGHFEHCSRIIFSTGTTDPWDTGCLKHSPSTTCPVVVVKEGGHHYDLREPDAKGRDTDSVKAVRKQEIQYLEKWLKEDSDARQLQR